MTEMKPMKDVLYIVVHCTSTRVNQKWTVEDIDRCHKAKNWAMIGYHWVIYQDGSIHEGRKEKYAGAHVKHYNEHAIGVCYVGGLDEKGRNADTRTPAQKAALWSLLKELTEEYPEARIVGHNELPKQRVPIELVLNGSSRDGSRLSQLPHVAKDCPCFSCATEYFALQPENRL